MNEQYRAPMNEQYRALLDGRHSNPHAVLGWHPWDTGLTGGTRLVTIRVRRPLATSVAVVFSDGSIRELLHAEDGIWEVTDEDLPSEYRIRAAYEHGLPSEADDPYRYRPMIGELDLHLIEEGRHEELWRALGAIVMHEPGGVSFRVWAPHARAVRVVGNFNGWDGRGHMMRTMGTSGVWELFVPELGTGEIYKYEILTAKNEWIVKADPMASWAEVSPATASVVYESSYSWGDGEWMRTRTAINPHDRPVAIYELHLGSWRPGRGYREVADELIEYVSWLGYTHVEFMPLAEHPFGGSWGYQVTGYYAATSRYGSPDDLRYLIDRLHQAGLGVIMDWVPGHFPRDEWALADFDGESLYEHGDPRRGDHPDWGTKVFDYGNSQVRNFLVANALFWLEEFHADGLRVDAVASMLYLDYSRADGQWSPNHWGGRENLEAISFLQEVNATAAKRSPGILMIAEESTSWPRLTGFTDSGGIGFGLKWNMGWMHDTLGYLAHEPVHRSYHQDQLTFSFTYAFSEHFVLPVSHDEVVHGKGSLYSRMPGNWWSKLANIRALLGFMWAHPGKKLLFMGQEYAQPGEWSERDGLDWGVLHDVKHHQVAEFVGELNRTYRNLPSLWQRDEDGAGLEFLRQDSAANVVAFLRRGDDQSVTLAVSNFSGIEHSRYPLGLPLAGPWRETLNSDAACFGGSGVGNLGEVIAVPEPRDGQAASAVLTLPPLATLWFTPGANCANRAGT